MVFRFGFWCDCEDATEVLFLPHQRNWIKKNDNSDRDIADDNQVEHLWTGKENSVMKH